VVRSIMATFNPENPVGFFIDDQEAIQRKLEQFARAGAHMITYLFDFDRTLTTSKHTGEDITTWYILHGLLPEVGRTEMSELRETYQPLELSGKLTEDGALTWWNSALSLYVKHPVNIDDVRQAARQVQLRDGTVELYKECDDANIPWVILSAGNEDVIDTITEEHGIHPRLTLSTKFVLAEDGRILGWDRGSMIHILNKRERGNTELSHLREERPYTVLVGDSLQDVDMAEGDEYVLRVRICDRVLEDPGLRQQYLEQSFTAGFDMVLEEDLTPLIEFTAWIAARS
jgi:HAD superfamily phosphoserine phosphatase-like hydrolase